MLSTKRLEIFGIFLLIFVSVFIFFWKLNKIPPSLYIDEALPGYSAYSILTTGKDEWGKSFPILFRFYGSFNPPLYTYLTVLPEYLWGLTVFSVRFVSAFSGVLLTILTFFFLRSLGIFKNRTSTFIGALIFCLSPWVVLYARTGYEVVPALLFFNLGAFLSYLSLKKQWLFVLGMTCFAISINFAYTERFLVPLFLIGFLLVFKPKKLLSDKKILFWSLLAFLVLTAPLLSLIGKDAFFPKSDLFYQEAILEQAKNVSHFLPFAITYSFSLIREFLSRYFTYFSFRSLFFFPDPDMQRSIPELSTFYFWMVVPYALGLYYLVKNRKEDGIKLLVLLLLISPLPASFTKDPFSTHRAFPLAFPLVGVITLGIDRLIARTKPIYWLVGFCLLLFISSVLLWRSYFVLFPKERARYWGYGIENLAAEIKKRPGQKFIVDQARVKPTYIALAFYLKYPPENFQKEVGKRLVGDYYQDTGLPSDITFGNASMRNIDWKTDVYQDEVLVGDELAISSGQAKEHFLEKIFEIKDPLGNIIFAGYKTNPAKKCLATRNLGLYCKK